ncbi:MAG: hypothetical protein R3C17_17225 [Planctomycetaceae bacterium]
MNPPVPFQPDLANTNDPTDVLVNIDTNSDGTPDTIMAPVKSRVMKKYCQSAAERVAPAPSMLPEQCNAARLVIN